MSTPIRLIVDPGVFDVPLNNRIEYVHGRDVDLLAMTNTLSSEAVGPHLAHRRRAGLPISMPYMAA